MIGERLIIVGNPEEFHVGAHLRQAAQALNLSVQFCDAREAFKGARWLRQVNWRLLGRRPTRLPEFGKRVIEACRDFRPDYLVTTGVSPIDEPALRAIGHMKTRRINFLTDDPWNPAHQAPWFLQALRQYDHVFSPRRSNTEALRRLGCQAVSYLPFAYSPEVHYRDLPCTGEEEERFCSDVMFAGGADRNRVPLIRALIEAGFRLALYGGYWGRWKETSSYNHGQADLGTLRKATRGSKVALCLVRRANRDGHVMRSFEIPATGGCMLTEDTEEHREIFGDEGENVVYFGSIPEMVQKARWLLDHAQERLRLAAAGHERITSGRNTYQDRLAAMLA